MAIRFQPGVISTQQAYELNRLAAKVERMESMLAPSYGSPALVKFPAKITAVDGSTPEKYSWTEQFYTSAGVYENKVNGRSGTTSDMWAYERNGIVATTFPFYAELTQRVRVDATVVYEFDAPPEGNVTTEAKRQVIQAGAALDGANMDTWVRIDDGSNQPSWTGTILLTAYVPGNIILNSGQAIIHAAFWDFDNSAIVNSDGYPLTAGNDYDGNMVIWGDTALGHTTVAGQTTLTAVWKQGVNAATTDIGVIARCSSISGGTVNSADAGVDYNGLHGKIEIMQLL